MMPGIVEMIEPLYPYLDLCCTVLNKLCAGLEPWQIMAYSVGWTLILTWAYDFFFQHHEPFMERVKKTLFRTVKKIPYVRRKIEREFKKAAHEVEDSFRKKVKGLPFHVALPHKGLSEEELDIELKKYSSLTETWSGGQCSGMVYSGDSNLTKLMAKVYGQFLWTNPLHAEVFPDIRKMEAEIVRMACTMFNGGQDTCGSVTTGGTESIMLAIKSYRDRAYDNGIKHPEMVVPKTAHAAFDKGASYFRVKIIHIPVDPITTKVKVSLMKRAINKNTCMIVGSAPQFPYGVIDDIEEISKLGEKYRVPVHVDACLGGFLIAFMKKAGFQLPSFDFQLPGVTSISADTHKYGFAPKGSSIIMYKDPSYRKYQYFSCTDWPGGIYASPTFGGSRAGAVIAACWAAMMHFGEDGYVESTRKIISTTRYITEKLRQMKHIRVMGDPVVSVVAIDTVEFNIFRLQDMMTERGWHLSPLQFPSAIHLCTTLLHTKEGVADRFLNDIRQCIDNIMMKPEAPCEGEGAMYGMAQTIPDRSIIASITHLYFDKYYSTPPPPEHMNGELK